MTQTRSTTTSLTCVLCLVGDSLVALIKRSSSKYPLIHFPYLSSFLFSLLFDKIQNYRNIAAKKVVEHGDRDFDRSAKAKSEAQVYDEQIKQLSATDLPGAHWSEKAGPRIPIPSSFVSISSFICFLLDREKR